ncbi:MAG: hypothetical protein K2K80_03605 [Clostridia bacterium]|nr:hypothetical protein [Clostridia bacterium]
MKDKNGNKRKISFRYICWLIASIIMFTAFFLTLVFEFRIFDKFETTEIIKINGITNPDVVFVSGKLEISFLVDGKEISTYFQEPVGNPSITVRVGDKIQYLVENPKEIQLRRPLNLALLSGTEAVIVAIFIGATIYEIKKGM